jgi:hypothetical protein
MGPRLPLVDHVSCTDFAAAARGVKVRALPGHTPLRREPGLILGCAARPPAEITTTVVALSDNTDSLR